MISTFVETNLQMKRGRIIKISDNDANMSESAGAQGVEPPIGSM